MKRLAIDVTCKECENKIHIENEKNIRIMPVGYKDHYRYYVLCSVCGNIVIIEKEDIPKKSVRKLKLKI